MALHINYLRFGTPQEILGILKYPIQFAFTGNYGVDFERAELRLNGSIIWNGEVTATDYEVWYVIPDGAKNITLTILSTGEVKKILINRTDNKTMIYAASVLVLLVGGYLILRRR